MTPNNTLDRIVKHCGPIVLAMNRVLADEHWHRGRPLNSIVSKHVETETIETIHRSEEGGRRHFERKIDP